MSSRGRARRELKVMKSPDEQKNPESLAEQSSMLSRDQVITQVVEKLCRQESYEAVIHRSHHDIPMPSVEALSEAVENLRAILFPGYFGPPELTPQNMRYYVGSTLDRTFQLLSEQVKRGFCFANEPGEYGEIGACEKKSFDLTSQFISQLPQIRYLLSTDIEAAYEGDPAAKHPGETIFCYPSIRALTNHRIAHELECLRVPLIPRIITELAHSSTGIDIHPGAQIGKRFFMDHGTGIVIGETTIIGNNVRIYQGVTLGAKSFPKDDRGKLIKGIPRHPIVEDDVVIYSGATILGRVTIGKKSVIGGNVWLTQDVPPNSRIVQSQYQQNLFEHGEGI